MQFIIFFCKSQEYLMLCPGIEVHVKVDGLEWFIKSLYYRTQFSAVALEVQLYLVRFKTVTNLKMGKVLDDKKKNGLLES